MGENENKVYTNDEWRAFANGTLTSFLIANNLVKITVDDGNGKKATVKINKNGEYVTSYTMSEVQ